MEKYEIEYGDQSKLFAIFGTFGLSEIRERKQSKKFLIQCSFKLLKPSIKTFLEEIEPIVSVTFVFENQDKS